MLELIVFAFVLVAFQIIGGLLLVNFMMSEKYVKFMMKKATKFAKIYVKEMEKMLEEFENEDEE